MYVNDDDEDGISFLFVVLVVVVLVVVAVIDFLTTRVASNVGGYRNEKKSKVFHRLRQSMP